MTLRDWTKVARDLGARFEERAASVDDEDRFPSENYDDLKREKVFSMLVPQELGGGGASYAELCQLLRELGRHCASTALALSMHQHLVAATVYRHKKGLPSAKLLERVAEKELVLVSTGATDWVHSNGSARRVEGGFRVNGRKVFGSGAPAGDILVTSFPFDDETKGPSVIHCPVPMTAEGVRRLDDWHALGMRGTGSHTIVLEDVFVPDEAIVVQRPRDRWHGAWDVVLGVAPPIYMAPYVGLAEAAADLALGQARRRPDSVPVELAIGEMENARTTAEITFQDMMRLTGDLDFTPSFENSNAQLVRKTILTKAVRATVEHALEVAGGAGFYRKLPFERMWRDVHASHYHPLPEKRQLVFTGRHRLGTEAPWDV